MRKKRDINQKFVIAVSYGNYLKYVGGTDKVIIAQKDALLSKGVSFVYLYPRISRFYHYWELIIDDEFMGIIDTEGFLDMVLAWMIEDKKELQGMYIHHLLNANLKDLSLILRKISMPVVYYIHDYYAVCENYFLLRNGSEYCGEGAVCEKKCGNCKSFKGADKRAREIDSFFREFYKQMEFIAPSECAGNIFLSAYPYLKEQIRIVLHQSLEGEYTGNMEYKEPVRIAYLGQQIPMKGWDEYQKLMVSLKSSGKYEFYYLGTGEERLPDVKSIDVSFQKTGNNAMIDALRENKIDIVFLYSIWPETYSFTYYEAMATNCFVITNENSGNIAAQVKKNGNGIVVKTITEITKLTQFTQTWKSKKQFGPMQLVESDKCQLKNNNQKCEIMQNMTYNRRKTVQIKINMLQLCIRVKRKIIGSKRA